MADSDTPSADSAAPEPELAPYLIENARSSRSKCRTCRRKIDKDTLRIGVLLEGPYGTGYLWHHLNCAAKRRFDDVAEAYKQSAWAPELKVPELAQLEKLKEDAEQKRADKKEAPWAERAKTGRSKCKHCDEPIAKDSWRVILDRMVEFFGQERRGPVNIHPHCVAAELQSEDCPTEVEGFFDVLRENCADAYDSKELDELVGLIGAIE
jgi:hypothetical protein